MVFSILVIFFIVAAAASVLWLVVSQRQDNVVEWIGESWRSVKKEEDNDSNYSVEMRDANIGEIFSAFERGDSPAYYTPEQVEDQWNRMVEAERSAVCHIRARFHHETGDDTNNPMTHEDTPVADTAQSLVRDTSIEENFDGMLDDPSRDKSHDEEPPPFSTVRFA